MGRADPSATPGHDSGPATAHAWQVRRCADLDALRATLAGPDADVLPILFTDGQRSAAERALGPELAALGPGEEVGLGALAVSVGPGEVVVAPPSGPEALLAARYAAITGRPIVTGDGTWGATVAALPSAPTALVWFCALDEPDIAAALDELGGALTDRFDAVPPIGLLTGDTPASLTWVMAKQLVPHGAGDRTTIVVTEEPAGRSPSLLHLDPTRTAAEVVATVSAGGGTILVNGHSRPHCGILPVADGAVGLCGLPSGGADGRCVDGTACYFGTAPRVVLQELRAPRVFFNGCTTGGVGARRADHLPRDSFISHATMRGATRELVGNVRTGHYEEADLDWFLGASALGCSPAQAVDVIEAAREASGREVVRSALYFGDVANEAWPVEGVVVGSATTGSDGVVRLRWERTDRVLIARVPGRRWAQLARADRLHAGSRQGRTVRIAVVADPSADATLVLVRLAEDQGGDGPEGPGGPPPSAVEVEMTGLAEPVDRTVGEALADALERVRWLAALPAFEELLAGAPAAMEDALRWVRRALSPGADLATLPELASYARTHEASVAEQHDGAIVDEALRRSEGYWNWQAEYRALVRSTPRPGAVACPSCEAFATVVDHVDWTRPAITRSSTVCGICGVVADEADGPLRARLRFESILDSATEVTGVAEVVNEGRRPRPATLGVAVERGGEVGPGSLARTRVLVAPGSSAAFDFRLTPVVPWDELYQLRLYVVSEGALSIVTRFILFGRRTDRGRTGPS